MSSPFAAFRKHQKGLMAATVLMAMFSFIVLGAADQLFNNRGPADIDEDKTVATWSGGNFTEKEIKQIGYNRAVLNQFVNNVHAAAAENARLPGFQPRDSFIVADEEELVASALFAEEGRRLGVVIPDANIEEFIKNLSTVSGPGEAPRRDTVRPDQLRDAVKNVHVGDVGVSFNQIKEALRRELLVQETMQLLRPSTSFDLAATPAERWEYFCRFNRRMKLQVYPIDVTAYLDDKRIPDPTEAQLTAFYDAHKDEQATRLSPEIGFKQPDRAKLEFLRADYVTFVDLAKSKLTGKEIQDEFAKRKDDLRSVLERDEDMLPPIPDEPEDKTKAPEKVIQATEPDPTPYEEAIGLFAKKPPRATEPAFTDDEVLARNREQLVKSLAERRARELMGKALDAAYTKMAVFHQRQWRPWLAANDGKPADERQPAPKFDLAALADPKNGLQYSQTGMLAAEDVQLDKSLRTASVNLRWGKITNPTTGEESEGVVDPGTRLATYLFGNSRSTMSPFRGEDEVKGTGDNLYRNQYVFWLRDSQKELLPEFADIRAEVRRAWKLANASGPSARSLAMAQAERHAQDANGQNKTIKELFSDSPDVKETSEFAWYTPSELPLPIPGTWHIGPPRLTRLDEVKDGGYSFARSVLNLVDKQAAGVLNDSGTMAYVVQPFDSPSSTREALRTQFKREKYFDYQPVVSQIVRRQEGLNLPPEQGYVWASRPDMERRFEAWLEKFKESYQLTWKRPAYRGRE